MRLFILCCSLLLICSCSDVGTTTAGGGGGSGGSGGGSGSGGSGGSGLVGTVGVYTADSSTVPIYVLIGKGATATDIYYDSRLGENEMFILPKDALDANTLYEISLIVMTGTGAGTEAFTDTWSFTTNSSGDGGYGQATTVAEINAYRSAAGVSAITENANYSIAAIKHAGYQQEDGAIGHGEPNTSNSHYVNTSFSARITAAIGVHWATGSGINTVSEGITSLGNKVTGVNSLWNTVYHRLAMMRSTTEILGSGNSGDAPSNEANSNYLTLDYGGNTGNALISGVWPNHGTTNHPLSFRSDSEGPDPISSGNSNGTPDDNFTGGPIHITLPSTAAITGLSVNLAIK